MTDEKQKIKQLKPSKGIAKDLTVHYQGSLLESTVTGLTFIIDARPNHPVTRKLLEDIEHEENTYGTKDKVVSTKDKSEDKKIPSKSNDSDKEHPQSPDGE